MPAHDWKALSQQHCAKGEWVGQKLRAHSSPIGDHLQLKTTMLASRAGAVRWGADPLLASMKTTAPTAGPAGVAGGPFA